MSPSVGEIVLNRELIAQHFLMRVRLPVSWATPLPGQFVMVRVRDGRDLLLRRPLSVYTFDRNENSLIIELIYRIAGKGTFALSRRKAGEYIEILGPLGHGFDIFPEMRKIVLLAGGIGVAPLSFLASHYRELPTGNQQEIISYLGAKSTDQLVGADKMKELSTEMRISTDDGSSGHHGFITELLADDMESFTGGNSVVYACGPSPMMRRLAEVLNGQPIPCQVSVEERMACGIGACLGCAIHVKDRGDKTSVSHGGTKDNEPQYKHVCKDGPVFNIRDIIWS